MRNLVSLLPLSVSGFQMEQHTGNLKLSYTAPMAGSLQCSLQISYCSAPQLHPGEVASAKKCFWLQFFDQIRIWDALLSTRSNISEIYNVYWQRLQMWCTSVCPTVRTSDLLGTLCKTGGKIVKSRITLPNFGSLCWNFTAEAAKLGKYTSGQIQDGGQCPNFQFLKMATTQPRMARSR